MLDPRYKVSRDSYEMDCLYSIMSECNFYLKYLCDSQVVLCCCQRNLLSSWIIIPMREKNLLILVELTTIAIVDIADIKDNQIEIELNKGYQFIVVDSCKAQENRNSSQAV